MSYDDQQRRRRGDSTPDAPAAARKPGAVSVYPSNDARVAVPVSNVELARAMAHDLDADALADGPGAGSTPYDWLLIRPSGEVFAVSEAPDNDDDHFVVVERPDAMRRLDLAAQSEPLVGATIEYRAGEENGPHRDGATVLRIQRGGEATLEHRRMGRAEVWRGQIVPASLARFFDSLGKSAFPASQPWPMPVPDETARELVIETDARRSVTVPWHAALKAPGYADAFRLLDEMIGQLSNGKVTLVRQTGDVHVVNPHKVS